MDSAPVVLATVGSVAVLVRDTDGPPGPRTGAEAS
jgi:hypothetical protein